MASWPETYTKQTRPGIEEIRSYLGEASSLFEAYSQWLGETYGMSLTRPQYHAKAGWQFQYSYKNVPFLSPVRIIPGGFSVAECEVRDAAGYARAQALAQESIEGGFLPRAQEKIDGRNAAQAARSRARLERERQMREAMLQSIPAERLNRFRWSPRVPRQLLLRLYESDAQMRLDEALVDEVGFMLYTRCLQGRDERALADQGKIKCHHCGEILPAASADGLTLCACGYGYIYREYMRSFNRDEMPARSAAAMFNAFLDRWPGARTPHEKMALIDWVIHQCHINLTSGVKRHFAGCNLIEGRRDQVEALILQLAYGGGS